MELIRNLSASSHLEALALQDSLWVAYAATPSFSSISAFPSMHVGHRNARLSGLPPPRLVAQDGQRRLSLGSIFLGWHYAIDGYAGAGFALASWWIAGLMERYRAG